MQRYLIILFIGLSSIGLTCCAAHFATSSKWIAEELPPSQIIENGEPFYGGRFYNGTNFSVYYDNDMSDGEYYYDLLMQDFGWYRKNTDEWEGTGALTPKRGYLYIGRSRGVAIYFYPGENYKVFKLKIRN
jgi:hypothetical protein